MMPRDELIALLGRKGVKGDCEVCHSSEGWFLPDQEHSRIVGLFNPHEKDLNAYVMPGGIIPAFVMVCKHCANIRIFSEVILSRFLEAEKGSGGSDG